MTMIELAAQYYPLVMAQFLTPFFSIMLLGVFVKFISKLGS